MAQDQMKEEVIDGVKYTVRMLPPRRARTMLVEMAKVAGPALAGLAQNGKEAEVDLGQLAQDLASKLSPEMLDDHMVQLAKVSEADGINLATSFDIHFMGHVGTMFKWYVFALRTNFQDFMDALGVDFSLPLPKAIPSPSQSPSTSPGKSGG